MKLTAYAVISCGELLYSHQQYPNGTYIDGEWIEIKERPALAIFKDEFSARLCRNRVNDGPERVVKVEITVLEP